MSEQYQHSTKAGLIQSGDPLAADSVVMFCNDRNSHWYLVVVDRQRTCVIHYDSAHFSQDVVDERCRFALTFVNNLRKYVIGRYPSIQWDRNLNDLNPNDIVFTDGDSLKQRNSFDCGVFAMVNADCFIRSWDHHRFPQEIIPLVRAIFIRTLFSFAVDVRFPLL